MAEPVVVDYSKRSIAENIFDPGAWQNLLGGVGEIVAPAVDVWNKIENAEEAARKPAPIVNPTIERNLSISDFAFTPNMYLVGFGLVLLTFAYILRK